MILIILVVRLYVLTITSWSFWPSDVVTLQIKQVFKFIIEMISYRDYLSIDIEW